MLEEKALNTIKSLNMISFNDKILVGVSGGPDSISLLRFLLSLKKEFNLSVYVAHLNHKLRGKDSDEDAEFVIKIANKLKLSYKIEDCDINEYSKKYSLSIEEAARESRYRFYSRTAKIFNANKISLGHNADDQAETVLMRIIRGCGVEGLMGIPPVRGSIIRPLIECTREEIKEYCRKNNFKYRIDLTNRTPIYFRNKIRLKLLPILSEEYNENIKGNLLKLRNIISEVSEYLQKETEEAFCKVTNKENTEKVIIDLGKLNLLSLAIKRRIIRKSIKVIKGNLYDIHFKHIHQIMELINCQSGEKRLELPDRIIIKKRYDHLIVFKEKQIVENKKIITSDWEYGLSTPGKEKIKSLRITIETKVMNLSEVKPLEFSKKNKSYSEFTELIDFDKVKFPIKIRNKRHGDRFFPLKMNGSKKVKKYFIDKKIPKGQRNLIPLLVDDEEKIICVLGLRLDNRVKIEKTTEKILYVKIMFSNQINKI